MEKELEQLKVDASDSLKAMEATKAREESILRKNLEANQRLLKEKEEEIVRVQAQVGACAARGASFVAVPPPCASVCLQQLTLTVAPIQLTLWSWPSSQTNAISTIEPAKSSRAYPPTMFLVVYYYGHTCACSPHSLRPCFVRVCARIAFLGRNKAAHVASF